MRAPEMYVNISHAWFQSVCYGYTTPASTSNTSRGPVHFLGYGGVSQLANQSQSWRSFVKAELACPAGAFT